MGCLLENRRGEGDEGEDESASVSSCFLQFSRFVVISESFTQHSLTLYQTNTPIYNYFPFSFRRVGRISLTFFVNNRNSRRLRMSYSTSYVFNGSHGFTSAKCSPTHSTKNAASSSTSTPHSLLHSPPNVKQNRCFVLRITFSELNNRKYGTSEPSSWNNSTVNSFPATFSSFSLPIQTIRVDVASCVSGTTPVGSCSTTSFRSFSESPSMLWK